MTVGLGGKGRRLTLQHNLSPSLYRITQRAERFLWSLSVEGRAGITQEANPGCSSLLFIMSKRDWLEHWNDFKWLMVIILFALTVYLLIELRSGRRIW